MAYLSTMASVGVTLIALGVTAYFTLNGDSYAYARHFGAIIGIAGLFIIGIVVLLAVKEDKNQGSADKDIIRLLGEIRDNTKK